MLKENFDILLATFSLILSAIFSGMEAAYLASDKLILKIDSHKNSIKAYALRFILKNHSYVMATLLLCVTLSLMIYSAIFSDTLSVILKKALNTENDFAIMIINTFILTIITLIFAEFIPKSTFMIKPYAIISIMVIPLTILCYIFYPLTWLLISISNITLRYMFSFKKADQKPKFEITDVQKLLEKSSSAHKNSISFTAQLAQNYMKLGTKRVRNMMTPISQLRMISFDSPISEIEKKGLDSMDKPIPIYRGKHENIIGFVCNKNYLSEKKIISGIVQKPLITTPSNFIRDLLSILLRRKMNAAVVVDELDKTVGVIYKGDILKALLYRTGG